MKNSTAVIREIFLEKNTLTILSLYNKFVDSSQSSKEQDRTKHQIRSVINNLRKKGEVVRISQSKYKKTDNLLDFRGMEAKPKVRKRSIKPKKEESFMDPKYDAGFD